MVVRQYNEELKYLEKITPTCWRIKKGFQPNMNVSLTLEERQPASNCAFAIIPNSATGGTSYLEMKTFLSHEILRKRKLHSGLKIVCLSPM